MDDFLRLDGGERPMEVLSVGVFEVYFGGALLESWPELRKRT